MPLKVIVVALVFLAIRRSLAAGDLLICMIALPLGRKVTLFDTVSVPVTPVPAGDTAPPPLIVTGPLTVPVPARMALVATVSMLVPTEPFTVSVPLLTAV